jgi:hypothetical protein
MQKSNIFTTGKWFFLYLGIFLFTTFPHTVHGDASPPLLLFFSGNVLGETEPCG